jgi:nucleoside-diphosphate-sugar epimerase
MLEGKKVLVTGGTGFIGGRLVEKLFLEQHALVRVLVRNFSRASRIARFPVEMIGGDVTDAEAVQQAVEGCDIVFHCAYDFAGNTKHRWTVSVKGTENVAQAALQAGVSRVVHVSTISVYGTPDGDLDETAPRVMTGDVYADTKLEAENLMLSYYRKHSLPVAIVQPTIVYGPFSRPWTISIVEQLQSEPVPLPDDGSGYCNAVYIDDVIDGMILAALKDEAVGELFLLSADEPVTWREFFGAYERILGVQSVVCVPAEELAPAVQKGPVKQSKPQAEPSVWQRWRKMLSIHEVQVTLMETPVLNWPYRFVKRVAPGVWDQFLARLLGTSAVSARPLKPAASGLPQQPKPAIQLRKPHPTRLALYQAKTRVRIDKARRVLGYKPAFNLERGMALTAEFIRWYNSN